MERANRVPRRYKLGDAEHALLLAMKVDSPGELQANRQVTVLLAMVMDASCHKTEALAALHYLVQTSRRDDFIMWQT